MASPETFRPQENIPPEVPKSGSLKSQLGKYVSSPETKIPQKKKAWARVLVQKLPDNYKGMVTEFIIGLPYEDRQKAAENLSGLIEGMGDQIWRSKYPKVEIQRCIDETSRWLRVNNKEVA